MRKLAILLLLFILTISSAKPTVAYRRKRSEHAVGWLYTPIASGLSVKFPLQPNLLLQPLFSLNFYGGENSNEGNYALGIRGILGFPNSSDLYPYIGAGLGHHRVFHSTGTQTVTDEERTGYQGFFGFEYRKHLIYPAIEFGITSMYRSDGSIRIGTSVNLGIYYNF
jgi:hypothetical protein